MPINDAQKKVLAKVTDLLSEHFDAYVLSLFLDGEGREENYCCFSCGPTLAMGILQNTQRAVLSAANPRHTDEQNV